MKRISIAALTFFSLIAAAQIIQTGLQVTVRDETGNTVSSAQVYLFKSQADYEKEVNQVAMTMTDKKGIASFKKLQPQAYYILVRKGDKDNSGGGEQTEKLTSARLNKITVIIQ
ncbi:MAG: carboxypeptidase regulatory-like domain-containing protein [Bacteroidetes bacterium]|nr:carboxypeptidase regulatory-like domain-containing protein [Bacteroidota bacterium]